MHRSSAAKDVIPLPGLDLEPAGPAVSWHLPLAVHEGREATGDDGRPAWAAVDGSHDPARWPGDGPTFARRSGDVLA